MKYESVLLLTYDTFGLFGFSQELLKVQNEHNENYVFQIFYGPFAGM